MTKELKACPFCDGKEVKLFKEGSIWVVECLQCLAKVGSTAEADVLDFWNSRPIENELPEKIGKLEEENARLREALEFYALGKHLLKASGVVCDAYDIVSGKVENGKYAQEVLEGCAK